MNRKDRILSRVIEDPFLMDSEDIREKVRQLPEREFSLAWNSYIVAKAGLTQDQENSGRF